MADAIPILTPKTNDNSADAILYPLANTLKDLETLLNLQKENQKTIKANLGSDVKTYKDYLKVQTSIREKALQNTATSIETAYQEMLKDQKVLSTTQGKYQLEMIKEYRQRTNKEITLLNNKKKNQEKQDKLQKEFAEKQQAIFDKEKSYYEAKAKTGSNIRDNIMDNIMGTIFKPLGFIEKLGDFSFLDRFKQKREIKRDKKELLGKRVFSPKRSSVLKNNPEIVYLADENKKIEDKRSKAEKRGSKKGLFGGLGSILGKFSIVAGAVIGTVVAYNNKWDEKAKDLGNQFSKSVKKGDIAGIGLGLAQGIFSPIAGTIREGGKVITEGIEKRNKIFKDETISGFGKVMAGATDMMKDTFSTVLRAPTRGVEVALDFIEGSLGLDANTSKQFKNLANTVIKPVEKIFDGITEEFVNIGKVWNDDSNSVLGKIGKSALHVGKMAIRPVYDFFDGLLSSSAGLIKGIFGSKTPEEELSSLHKKQKEIQNQLKAKDLTENEIIRLRSEEAQLKVKERDLQIKSNMQKDLDLKKTESILTAGQKMFGTNIVGLDESLRNVQQKRNMLTQNTLQNQGNNFRGRGPTGNFTPTSFIKNNIDNYSKQGGSPSPAINPVTVHPPVQDAVIRGREVYPMSIKDNIIMTQADNIVDMDTGNNYSGQQYDNSPSENRMLEIKNVLIEIYQFMKMVKKTDIKKEESKPQENIVAPTLTETFNSWYGLKKK